MDVRNFRVEPVTVEIGEKKKAIILRDLPYDKQCKLLNKIGSIVFSKDAFPTIIGGIETSIKQQMVEEQKGMVDAIDLFIEKVTDMSTKMNTEHVAELIKLATDDKVTDEDIQDMGSQEQAGFVSFLISRQFEALKNLNASLATILSPTKKENQK